MKLKKKIFLYVIGFFTLHALTWWIWGTEKLLIKGYEYLEGNKSCQKQFSIMTYEEIYEDSLYSYEGKKVWVTDIANADSIFFINIGKQKITVYKEGTKKEKGLFKEMDSTNVYYLHMFIGQETSNPYLQKNFFSCWAMGTDWDEVYEPILIWGFFDWFELTNWDSLMAFKYKFFEPEVPTSAKECFFCF